MSTSPHQASDGWAAEATFDDQLDDAFDVLTEEPPLDADPLFDQEAPFVEAPATTADVEVAYAEDSYEYAAPERPRSTVYASLPGMPGRGVIVVSTLATTLTAILDFALT